jgi:3-dehydrosphinganine reductase
MNFKGKTALISGGSSGIGFALARALALHGANVWLLARDCERLNSALEAIRSEVKGVSRLGGVLPCDVSDLDQVDRAMSQIIQEVGTPDILINSAGITHPGYVQDIDMEIFRNLMEVNYFGTVYLTKALLPGMIQRGSGYIVNISSMAGYVGAFGYTAYCASKFAVTGFTDALRSELKPRGIKVFIVYPPDTDTPQLAYENQFKPPETRSFSNYQSAKSAESVAAEIIHGMQGGKYVILPGLDNKFWYSIRFCLRNTSYLIMDIMVAHAQRRLNPKASE